jgi:hypothetical protein
MQEPAGEHLNIPTNRVVAHFLDGRVVKGTTQDFFPNRPIFRVRPTGAGKETEIECRQLKAVFFVKDLAGDENRKDIKGFVDGPGETPKGKKIAVRFKDGEFLCGYTLSYSSERVGFFLFPSDPGSNNLRVYVMVYAAADIRAGAQADAMAQKVLDEGRAA